MARFDLLQIGGKKLQTVSVMAEQVAFDQDVGDVAGTVAGHPGAGQQRLCKPDERGSVIARPGGSGQS